MQNKVLYIPVSVLRIAIAQESCFIFSLPLVKEVGRYRNTLIEPNFEIDFLFGGRSGRNEFINPAELNCNAI